MSKTNWTHGELAEVSELYRLARVPLSGTDRDCPYGWRNWAAAEYVKRHPEVSHKAVYLVLERGTHA